MTKGTGSSQSNRQVKKTLADRIGIKPKRKEPDYTDYQV